MAKKYTNTDLKSLKREEVINLLKENNIEFDSTQSLFSLRALLLDIEVEDEQPEGADEQATESEDGTIDNYDDEKSVAGEESENPEPEVEQPEPEKPQVDKEVAHAAFQNELSKRMATFGRAKQSVFSIELARRQGKVTGKISFAEELKIRQNKARR